MHTSLFSILTVASVAMAAPGWQKPALPAPFSVDVSCKHSAGWSKKLMTVVPSVPSLITPPLAARSEPPAAVVGDSVSQGRTEIDAHGNVYCSEPVVQRRMAAGPPYQDGQYACPGQEQWAMKKLQEMFRWAMMGWESCAVEHGATGPAREGASFDGSMK